MFLIYLVYHFLRLMYSMYYFNSGNFSLMHFRNAQSDISNIDAGADAGLGLELVKFRRDKVQQSVARLMREVYVDNLIDRMDLRCGAENELISNVKFTEQILSSREKYSDCAHTYQTAPDRGVIHDNVPCDCEKQHFKYSVRGVLIHHADQFYSDDQIKTGF